MNTARAREIEEIASDWLIRRDSGEWSLPDDAALQQWLNLATANRVAFLRLELAWEDAARLKALGAGVQGDRPAAPGSWNLTPFFEGEAEDEARQALASAASEVPDVECSLSKADLHDHVSQSGESVHAASSRTIVRQSKSVFFKKGSLIAAAASVVLAVGFATLLTFGPAGGRYATPVGGLASVPMADGSKVTLNTNSQIRIALTAHERSVELRQGEAFFEVSKDPQRPFVVRAGDKRVIAVGTKFSVRRDGDEIAVVVTEGKVRVAEGPGTSAFRDGGSADVFLTPGSIARMGESGVLVQRESLPDAEEMLSWRAGVLMFRNQTLADAVAEFNRYNARKLVIRDPAVASLKVEGNFRATSIDAFVRLLESGFPVHAEAQDDQIVLTAR
jgi:transmembrane sensor